MLLRISVLLMSMASVYSAVQATTGQVSAGGKPAAGKAQGSKPVTSFDYLDTNKDGRISPEEAKADWAVAQNFASADADRNGYLDKAEFKVLSRG